MKPLPHPPGRAELAYQAILEGICDGTLAPGTHLVQEDLASRLGVSRQPIQQAMARLRNDGLVEEVGARGLFVTVIDPERMGHHYDVRAALDGLAARRAADAAAVSASAAARMQRDGAKIIAAGSAAVASGSVADMVRHDVAFHQFIYARSGNPLLADSAESHWRYMRRVMADVLRRAQPPPSVWSQHREILKAVVKGDAARAESLAIEHVEGARSRLAEALAAPEAAS